MRSDADDLGTTHGLTEAVSRGSITRSEFIQRAVALGVSSSFIGTILSACGSSSESGGGAAATKDTLVTAWSATPERLNPQTTFSVPAEDYFMNIEEMLVRWKLEKQSDGNYLVPFNKVKNFSDLESIIEPRLAEDYTIDKDLVVHTFKLRKGVVGHAGNELTSEDVRFLLAESDFCFKGIGFNTHQVGSQTDPSKIKAIDKYTIEITLDKPNPLFIQTLCQFFRGMHDAKSMKANVTAADKCGGAYLDTHDIGYGAYKLTSYKPGQATTWEAVDGYAFDDKPTIKSVTNRAIPEGAQRVSLLVRGDVDVAWQLTPRELKSLQGNGAVTVHNLPGLKSYYLCLNSKFPPLDRPEVRRACAWAVPYDDILSAVFLDYGRQPISHLPDSYPGVIKSLPYTYDPDRAKSELARAGASGLTLNLSYNSADPINEPMAIQLQTGMKAAGINVKLEARPTAAFFEGQSKRTLPAFLTFLGPFVPDPFYGLFLNYHSESANNFAAYKNPEFDKLVDAGQDIIDYEQRLDASADAQTLLGKDVPFIPMAHRGVQVAARKGITGFGDYNEFTWYPNLRR